MRSGVSKPSVNQSKTGLSISCASTGLPRLTLVAPKASKTFGGAQLPKFRILPARDGNRLVKTCFGRSEIPDSGEQIASHPMHVGLGPAFLRRLDPSRRLVEAFEVLARTTRSAIADRKFGKKFRYH
jgi:hypothetical protein